MHIESPLRLYEGIVLPEWIDYNGHMNVASYVLVFDYTTDALMDFIGMGHDYRERSQCSGFVLETHVNYLREMIAGDLLYCTTQLLGFDTKRLHYFHRMYHADKGFLTATTELILIHVDLARRHSATMPVEILDRLSAIMTQHFQLPRPPQSGRVIGVRAKLPRTG